MKITYILETFRMGGKERRCLQLIQGLNKAGYNDIQLIIINDGIEYDGLHDCKCRTIVMDRKNRGLGFCATSKELYKHIKEFSPDIIQVWGIMSAFFICALSPFIKAGIYASYVADVRKPKFPDIKWLTNSICKIICKKIIGNSQAGLNAYAIPKSKSVLIYNGFNEERLHTTVDKEAMMKSLDINTPHIVIMAATFSNSKDYKCYIDAAKNIVKKRDDVTFLAAGSGCNWEKINNSIDNDERKYIKLIGARKDIDCIYQISTISVLMSNPEVNEGLSNTILESMAFGLPVIATNGGGTPEIIEQGKNGIMLSGQTPENLAEAITELLDNQEYREQLSQAARKTVSEKFSLTNMVNRFIEIYN